MLTKNLFIGILLSVTSSLVAQNKYIFPLKASNNKHFLVDQQGKPFFVHGDSPWHLAYNLTLEEVKKYLDDRTAKGFTSVLFQITPDLMGKGGNQPNLNGDYVFENADISKPNEKYFAHVDSVMDEVAKRGLAIFFFPMYTGCCHDGWQEIIEKAPNSVEKCRNSWYDLVPDWGHNVVISGRGTFNPGVTPGGEDYATVSCSTDGKLMVAYLPTYRKVSIQMFGLTENLNAQWFDPSDGKYYDAGNFKNEGMQDFTPPAQKNEQGFEDWVLILQSSY